MMHGLIDPATLPNLICDTLDEFDDILIVPEESNEGAANNAFHRASGYSHSEIVGRPLHLLIAPDADPLVYSRVTAAVKERRQLRTELPCCGSDSNRFWLGIHLMPVKRAELICSIVLARDITEARHERQQQNAIQSLLAKVFLCVPVAVAIISDDGLIQMSNPALDSLLGHRAGTLAGKRATDFVAPESRPAVLEARDRATSGRSRLYAGN
jgi:PAS domain S-box-containing protein